MLVYQNVGCQGKSGSGKIHEVILVIYNHLKDFFRCNFSQPDQHNLQDLRISYLVHLLWYRNRQVVFFAQKHDDRSKNLFLKMLKFNPQYSTSELLKL